jgi:hypothetical protein
MPDLDHLFVVGAVEGQEFKSPLSVRPRALPDRDRNNHGNLLLTQLRRWPRRLSACVNFARPAELRNTRAWQ